MPIVHSWSTEPRLKFKDHYTLATKSKVDKVVHFRLCRRFVAVDIVAMNIFHSVNLSKCRTSFPLCRQFVPALSKPVDRNAYRDLTYELIINNNNNNEWIYEDKKLSCCRDRAARCCVTEYFAKSPKVSNGHSK